MLWAVRAPAPRTASTAAYPTWSYGRLLVLVTASELRGRGLHSAISQACLWRTFDPGVVLSVAGRRLHQVRAVVDLDSDELDVVLENAFVQCAQHVAERAGSDVDVYFQSGDGGVCG